MKPEQAQDVARIGRTLSDATRVMALSLLAKGPRTVTSLCDDLKVAQPIMSYHLSLLRMGGLVNRVRKGKEMHYSVNRGALATVAQFLSSLK